MTLPIVEENFWDFSISYQLVPDDSLLGMTLSDVTTSLLQKYPQQNSTLEFEAAAEKVTNDSII